MSALGQKRTWREVAALAEQHIALTAQGHDIEACRSYIAYWMGSATWQQMPGAVRDSIIRTMPKVAAEWRLMYALPDVQKRTWPVYSIHRLSAGGRNDGSKISATLGFALNLYASPIWSIACSKRQISTPP